MSIKIGETLISKINIGEMGVKRILVGDTEVYNRSGGYFYLEFDKEGRSLNNG